MIGRFIVFALSWTFVTLCFAQSGTAQDTGAPQLSLPIACEPGKTCFIQSYVDIDPGPGVQDFACGSATYEGHKGVDFRLLSAAETAKHIAVLASADGTIKGVRDGMTDIFVSRGGGLASVKDRECGNGVVIDHGKGWETQYCHMLKGSVAVKPGDLVTRGQRLGDTGFSGAADFAHVHLQVRHNGEVIDPFSGLAQNAVCLKDKSSSTGLWQPETAKALGYANGTAISAGFTGALPTPESTEDMAPELPTATSAGLVFFARFINLRAGDQVKISVSGPDGFAAEDPGKPIDRSKATWLSYAGKKLTKPAWAPGRYAGKATLIRDGKAVTEIERTFDLAK